MLRVGKIIWESKLSLLHMSFDFKAPHWNYGGQAPWDYVAGTGSIWMWPSFCSGDMVKITNSECGSAGMTPGLSRRGWSSFSTGWVQQLEPLKKWRVRRMVTRNFRIAKRAGKCWFFIEEYLKFHGFIEEKFYVCNFCCRKFCGFDLLMRKIWKFWVFIKKFELLDSKKSTSSERMVAVRMNMAY